MRSMGRRPDGILNRKQAETIKRIAIDSTSIFGQFQLNISDGNLKIFQSLDGCKYLANQRRPDKKGASYQYWRFFQGLWTVRSK